VGYCLHENYVSCVYKVNFLSIYLQCIYKVSTLSIYLFIKTAPLFTSRKEGGDDSKKQSSIQPHLTLSFL